MKALNQVYHNSATELHIDHVLAQKCQILMCYVQKMQQRLVV